MLHLFCGARSWHPAVLAHTLVVILGAASLTTLLLAGPAQAATFLTFGVSDGGWDAHVSGDGTVVAGTTTIDGQRQAFRWELYQGGVVGLGDLAGGGGPSTGRAVSADGKTVVGSSGSSPVYSAFKWDAANQMVGIHTGLDNSLATGVSADGDVILVEASSGKYRLHGDGSQTAVSLLAPHGLSDDGALVPGFYLDEDQRRASVEGAGPLDIFIYFIDEEAEAVSADGSIAVGHADDGGDYIPLRWVNGEPEVILGPGEEYGQGQAFDITPDGSTIVGLWHEFGIWPSLEPGMPFVWDDVNGMRLIDDLAADDGIDLSGWKKMRATGVSHDGLTLVGTGKNPDGDWEPWLFSLTGLPEPSTGLMISVALAVLAFLVPRDRRRIES